MAKMPYICLYLSYLDSFEELSDAARGKLLLAMLRYAHTGEGQKLTGDAKILWPMVRSQMDRDAEKYRDKCETNRLNGAKGGRPPKNPPVLSDTDGLLEKADKAKEKEKEKENKNDNDNNKEREKEKEKERPDQTRPLSPAPLDDDMLSFVRDVERIRRSKGYYGDTSYDSLIPLGIPKCPQAGSSAPDRWRPK